MTKTGGRATHVLLDVADLVEVPAGLDAGEVETLVVSGLTAYHDPDLPTRVRELAPHGVDAVFDHIGGKSIARSWSVLAKGGTLVSYAMLKDTGPRSRWPNPTPSSAEFCWFHDA